MKKIHTKNLLKPTTDKINKRKLREYENLFELVLSGIIRIDDNEANDFLNNLDGYTIDIIKNIINNFLKVLNMV